MDSNTLPYKKLLHTVSQLRSDRGCPWDRKQTPLSICKYLREEVDELVEAIEKNDRMNIREEIGDVFYILVMLAQMHSEKGEFTLDECIAAIDAKLIRRHPHVFAGEEVADEEELRRQWQKIKNEEKKNILT